jgi:hypothetical protein
MRTLLSGILHRVAGVDTHGEDGKLLPGTPLKVPESCDHGVENQIAKHRAVVIDKAEKYRMLSVKELPQLSHLATGIPKNQVQRQLRTGPVIDSDPFQFGRLGFLPLSENRQNGKCKKKQAQAI